MIQGYKDITESVDVLPFGDSACLPIQDIFVPLLMEEDLATKERLHRPDAPSGKKIEHIKDLFNVNGKSAERIFIKGEAGSGKTLLCIKLLDAWCRAKQTNTRVLDELQQCMSVFDLAFYIPLRHVPSDIMCVKDMVEQFVSRSCQEQLGNLSAHCLVIMDGLDEWPSTKGYTELPKMTGLVNCTLLCTMRPWKLTQLKIKFKPYDKIVQLLGLKPQSVESLITHVLTKFYRLKDESEDFKSKFTRYLSMTKQSVFGSLIEMPMMLTTFCCMWYENDIYDEKENSQNEHKSYHSMTYTYLSLMEAMIRRADEKHDLRSLLIEDRQTMLSKFLSYFEKQPKLLTLFPYIHKYIDSLLPLCRFAYDNLMAAGTKLVFQKQQLEEDVGHKVTNLALKVGLISQVKAPGRFLKENVSINFYHKSIQEFMAAIYIACGISKCISLLCSNLSYLENIMEQANLIRFVMGLKPTAGFRISGRAADVINKNRYIKYYRQGINRGNASMIMYSTQCQWYREITTSLKLTNESLPYCSIIVNDIFLDKNSDSDIMRMTAELMHGNKKNITSVAILLVTSPLSDLIQYLPQCSFLTALRTAVNNQKDNDQLVASLPYLTCLVTIQYSGSNHIPSSSRTAAAHTILQLKQLKRIIMENVDLCEDTVVLTSGMRRLKKLELRSVKMSAISWERCVSGLLSIRHSVDVELWHTNVDDDTVHMIQSLLDYTVTRDYKGEQHDNYYALGFSTEYSHAGCTLLNRLCAEAL